LTTVLLIIHLFVTLALIGVVLIQRSEGGGLGIGTAQGMGSFMSGRGTANLLTRATAILATVFMALSLALALMNRGTSGVGSSILDTPVSAPAPVAPAPAPGSPAPGSPASGSAAPGAAGGTAPTGTPATTAPATGTPATGAPASGTPATPSGTPPAASGTTPAPQQGPTVPTN